jgi:hypothetical protein
MTFYVVGCDSVQIYRNFDIGSAGFRKVLRAILVYLLVYRLNESRINIEKTTYFEGLGKFRYGLQKLRNLLKHGVGSGRGQCANEILDTRKKNLSVVLANHAFAKHATWLLDGSHVEL